MIVTKEKPVYRFRYHWHWVRRHILGLLVAGGVLAAFCGVVVMEAMFRLPQEVIHSYGAPLQHTGGSYSMRINTFRRNDLLRRSIEHYSKCSNIEDIIVVWSDQENPPPDISKWQLRPTKPHVEFEVHAVDRLSNRFKPLKMPATEAILSIDDDIIIRCEHLSRAMEVWESAKGSLVGFSPRMHTWDKQTRSYRYRSWWYTYWNGYYSIMLTKSAFLHRKYLEAFHALPASLVDYVDGNRNCEDILMAFVVAKESGGKPPLWVGAPAIDDGDGGISSGTTHFDHRSECINIFAKSGHFQGMPLVITKAKVVDATREWTWAS
uniref:Glycosyl transferase 64 domain-containing protein n=1 Tax=Pinguiococcus pyrenoidosus TaxID=172671 RepID=A0A7R9UDH5_9STRA|mmetsp:Transcript_6370/g.24748  ORF Transcript_6370/g.24748 Transcript_6370/m.24748 type:complete len:321 (+) Transcript_6370:113-1075(+)